MGVTRYIRQHHIGLIALFVALTGTAYAGTQVANRAAEPQVLKAKKKVKRGPAGPQGPQGTPGVNGANGSARAYGQVSGQGLVDTTRSTPGVTAVRTAEGQYCVTVPGLTSANAVFVPVMEHSDGDSVGGDTASARQVECAPNFGVRTFNATGSVDDAGFNFVIP